MLDPIIDPEDFPFGEAELRAALCQVLSAERAAARAQEHAIALRGVRQERDVYRAKVATGYIDTPFISYPAYIWEEPEVLALLSRLSEVHAARVAAHRARRVAVDRPLRARQALWRTTGQLDVQLPPEVEAQLDAEDRKAESAWRRVVRKVDRLISAHGSA